MRPLAPGAGHSLTSVTFSVAASAASRRLWLKMARRTTVPAAGKAGKRRYRLTDGREFASPSAAGKAVMGGTACNGWRFWSVAGAEPAAGATPPTTPPVSPDTAPSAGSGPTGLPARSGPTRATQRPKAESPRHEDREPVEHPC